MSIPKKYFWLKLKDTFFANPKIKKLRKIAGGDTFSVIYLKLMLLSLKNDGVIEIEGLEPTIEEELALILDEEVDNVRLTVNYLKQTQLMQSEEYQVLLMTEVPALIGKESESANRVRKLRAKNKTSSLLALQCNAHVTACSKSVTTEIELEKELELDKDSLYSLSQKISFQQFRKHLSTNAYKFGLDNGLCGYRQDTRFAIKSNGYIQNLVSGEDVTISDAQKIWDYLYGNRQKIISQLQTKEVK